MKTILLIILTTILVELITITCRYFFGNIKNKFKKFQLNPQLRLHHGELGLIFIILNFIFFHNQLVLITGWTLFLSDMIHRFIVLPIWVGETKYR
ncbi:hypothetical protein HOC01_00555 [archaeon]|nr:hypothetical protein [archaeon]MBT6698669.1 hypothetical protein [archaeon]